MLDALKSISPIVAITLIIGIVTIIILSIFKGKNIKIGGFGLSDHATFKDGYQIAKNILNKQYSMALTYANQISVYYFQFYRPLAIDEDEQKKINEIFKRLSFEIARILSICVAENHIGNEESTIKVYAVEKTNQVTNYLLKYMIDNDYILPRIDLVKIFKDISDEKTHKIVEEFFIKVKQYELTELKQFKEQR